MAGGDTERLWLEVAMRLGGDNREILAALTQIKQAQAEAAQASGEMGGKAKAEADKVAGAFGEVAKIAAGVFTGIKVADLVKDFKEFHTSTMDQVAGLVSLADRYGLTTDQLQAYQGAARKANVTNEELNKTLGTFNQNVGQANAGSKAQLEAFAQLGIKIRDVHGNLRPMPDLLYEASRALLQVENGSTRASIGSALLGEKGARLIPLMRELGVPIEQLVDRGKAFGEIVDREVAEKLDRAKNASEAANQQLKALYATVAAPLHAQGMEYLASLTSDLTRRLREAQKEATILGQMDKLFGQGGQAGAMKLQPAQKQVESELDAERKNLARLEAQPERRRAITHPAEIAAARAKIQRLEAEERARGQELANAADMQRLLSGEGSTPADSFRTAGASSPPPTGSGGDKRDRIGEALNQLKGEVAAAQSAYDQLRAGYGVPLEQLEREVDLRKKIADEIAKLGKYDPKDPRVQQIKDLVRAHEELETKLKQTAEANRNAVEIERRMGDGRAFLKEQTRILNDALDTGRLSYEAYSAQMRDATDKAEDMRLKLLGQQEGFQGLIAGMQYAATQWERNNRSFQVGGRLYEKVVSDMTELTTAWGDSFDQTAQRILNSWVNLLTQMAMQEAARGLFKGIGGLFGGGGDGTAPGLFDSLFTSTMGSPFGYAGGGDPPVGMPSWVGEEGPELIVPKVPSTVLNRGQLAAIGAGGGDQVVINQTMYFGSDVSRATLMTWGEQVKNATLAEVADQKRRGTALARGR